MTATVNFRTAAFDLDSVFGGGPGQQPYLYTAGDKLLTGTTDGFVPHDPGQPRPPGLDRISLAVPGSGPATSRHDHPRGPNERALIGDPRKDENVIVLQLHTAIAAFYNRVIDPASEIIKPAVTGTERSFRARRITRHHYQWVVVNDYLRRILHPAVFADIEAGIYPRQFTATGAPYPFIPIEFAGAAYRFGHSMVRPNYTLNRIVGADPQTRRVPIFDAAGNTSSIGDLRSFRPLPGFWGIDWGFFLDGLDGAPPDNFPGSVLQPSYRIDTQLAIGLKSLPDHANEADIRRRNLAFLNLLRGNTLRLPSAEQLQGRVPLPGPVVGTIPTLDWDNIWSAGSHRAPPVGTPSGDAELDALRAERRAIGQRFRQAHGDHTPLWYYVLREAEWYGVTKDPGDIRGGQHLGPLASAIIADTFIGLLEADADSYRKVPGWEPLDVISNGNTFGLPEMLKWALA